MSWSTVVLTYDSDLELYESNIINRIQVPLAKYHALAKEEIELRLWKNFHDMYTTDYEMSSDLDLIVNPGILKRAAIFLCLHLIFEDCIHQEDDYNARKSEFYFNRFEDAFKQAIELLIWEYDDVSGQIQGSEQWGILRRW